MAQKYCVVIDFTGIQAYVFGSNMLNDNLGASYLLENIFKNIPSYADIFSQKSIDQIKKEESPANNNEIIGYDGGGNKIMFFDTEEDAKNFIKEFSLYLLMVAPGLGFASAIKRFDLDGNNKIDWKNGKNDLFKDLAINKSKHPANTVIPRHGITAECVQSGFSMDVFAEDNYVSSTIKPKLSSSEKSKKENDFADNHPGYKLTNGLDNLGQRINHENFIAIVHIDGNDMGLTFESIETIEETRALSAKIKEHVKNSFDKLLEHVVEDIENNKYKDLLDLRDKDVKDSIFLPLRSIILGGDDITFVSEGKLGIYLAKLFMEYMSELELPGGKKLSTCAGVAIQNTKFPFYRGYKIAEQLCDNAKKKRRTSIDNGKEGENWFDFHISYGGYSGSLEEIRDLHYTSERGKLYSRPYRLEDFSALENEIKFFNKRDSNGKLIIANNKIKELREVLSQGESAQNKFIDHLNSLRINLYSDKTQNSLFVDGATKYLDIIELLEFYPKQLIKGGN
ncbi:MAG: hypothetical protein M0P71_07965 [Melioribacteraceae bacterium]|nr:hypothetical protein [Melioribacteraceae bacterium]